MAMTRPCEKAMAKGLRAFKLRDQELSLLHFTLVNTHTTADSRSVGHGGFGSYSGGYSGARKYDYGKKGVLFLQVCQGRVQYSRCEYDRKCIM